MPGEFEAHEGCLMIWPQRPGSWPYTAQAAKRVFAEVATAISESEYVYMLADPALVGEARAALPEDVTVVPMESDDAWARDVGPTFLIRGQSLPSDKIQELTIGNHPTESMLKANQVESFITGSTNKGTNNLRGINWGFNAWGGTYDGLYSHYEHDDAVAAQFCDFLGVPCYDAHPFVLEGGSIHSDGEGTILTTEACLLSPGRNPSLKKEEITQKLKDWLGAEQVIWLPHGIYGDETNEHVDNICAFVRPGEVVLAWTDNPCDPQYAYSQACLQALSRVRDACGRSIKVHKLPIPKKPICITEEDLPGYVYEEGEAQRTAAERLAASYVNFYISNEAVIVPQFHDENDAVAVQLLADLFPSRRIYPIYARDILLGGGNIHCITQQIPA